MSAVHWNETNSSLGPGGAHNIDWAILDDIRGIRLSGNHIMVTTQFTGCSFCMQRTGAELFCAHVTPFLRGYDGVNTTGPELAARAVATGGFSNAGFVGAGPFRVYGRN